MRKKTFVTSLCLLIVFLCTFTKPSLIAASNDIQDNIRIENVKRSFLIHLPAKFDRRNKYPLLIAIHGRLGTGQSMSELTHFNQIADKEGFIVVYPDGYRKSWADGRGRTPADRRGFDDVLFIKNLFNKLFAEYPIDRDSVFITGISNGGLMTLRLGCELSDYISGIGVVAANMSEEVSSYCSPKKEIKAIFINGDADPLMPINGGGPQNAPVLSASDTAQKWAKFNGCYQEPILGRFEDKVNDDTKIRYENYHKCNKQAKVSLLVIEGGGHAWPGGIQYFPEKFVGKISKEIDASQTIWEFLLSK